MNDQHHPSYADLAAYVEQPNNKGAAAVRLHLTRCVSCRQIIDDLERLRGALSNVRHAADEPPGGVHLGKADIARYIAAEESDPARVLWQNHISQCDTCQETVLLARARRRKQLRLANFDTTPAQATTPDNYAAPDIRAAPQRKPLKHALQYASLPLALAAGFVLAAITLPLWQTGQPSRELQLATYRDDPLLRFNDASRPQGLGFFAGAEEHSEAYAGVRLKAQDDGSVRAYWPAIEGATDYHLQVYGQVSAKPSLILDIRTPATETRIPQPLLKPSQRYEWRLSGATRDGASFVTSGGFVAFVPTLSDNP
jgi:hypothetical protein